MQPHNFIQVLDDCQTLSHYCWRLILLIIYLFYLISKLKVRAIHSWLRHNFIFHIFPISFPIVKSGTSIHNVSEKGNLPKHRNAWVYMFFLISMITAKWPYPYEYSYIQMCHIDLVSTAYYPLQTAVKTISKIWSYATGHKCRLSNKYLSILESFKAVILLKNDVQFYSKNVEQLTTYADGVHMWYIIPH